MSIRAFGVLLSLLFAVPLSAQPVPFEICAQSTTWVRPSAQMQQTKIWNDHRYKDFARDAYAWTHNFLVIDDFPSVSVTVTLTNLSGLWTAKPLRLYECY